MPDNDILVVPNPLLRQQCREVSDFDSALQSYAEQLQHAALRPERAAVAAPQIGLAIRAFAVSSSEFPAAVIVNPHITEIKGMQSGREKCLSIPGYEFIIVRAKTITLIAQRIDGSHFEFVVSDWLARVIQHECDHLDGVLITDRASEQVRGLPRQQRRAIERAVAKAEGLNSTS
jgi:peptide deformylase